MEHIRLVVLVGLSCLIGVRGCTGPRPFDYFVSVTSDNCPTVYRAFNRINHCENTNGLPNPDFSGYSTAAERFGPTLCESDFSDFIDNCPGRGDVFKKATGLDVSLECNSRSLQEEPQLDIKFVHRGHCAWGSGWINRNRFRSSIQSCGEYCHSLGTSYKFFAYCDYNNNNCGETNCACYTGPCLDDDNWDAYDAYSITPNEDVSCGRTIMGTTSNTDYGVHTFRFKAKETSRYRFDFCRHPRYETMNGDDWASPNRRLKAKLFTGDSSNLHLLAQTLDDNQPRHDFLPVFGNRNDDMTIDIVCHNCITPGIDENLGDLSLNQCSKACYRKANCWGINYDSHGDVGTCQLSHTRFTGEPTTEYHAGWAYYRKTTRRTCWKFIEVELTKDQTYTMSIHNQEGHQDYDGNDVYDVLNYQMKVKCSRSPLEYWNAVGTMLAAVADPHYAAFTRYTGEYAYNSEERGEFRDQLVALTGDIALQAAECLSAQCTNRRRQAAAFYGLAKKLDNAINSQQNLMALNNGPVDDAINRVLFLGDQIWKVGTEAQNWVQLCQGATSNPIGAVAAAMLGGTKIARAIIELARGLDDNLDVDASTQETENRVMNYVMGGTATGIVAGGVGAACLVALFGATGAPLIVILGGAAGEAAYASVVTGATLGALFGSTVGAWETQNTQAPFTGRGRLLELSL